MEIIGGGSHVVYADAFEKNATNTRLGTNGIARPAYGAGGWSYVYYGKFNGNALKYRVLNPVETAYGGRTLFLDCDSVLENLITKNAFNDTNSNDWDNCCLNKYLNDTYNYSSFLKDDNKFSSAEREAIASSVKGNETRSFKDLLYRGLDDCKIFVLDVSEAINQNYGYAAPPSRTQTASDTRVKGDKAWWLRSPITSTMGHEDVGYVKNDGKIDNAKAVNTGSLVGGVSPAFNIDLNSVIFSSAISGTYGAQGSSYKLTIKDARIIMAVENDDIENDGNELTVPYMVTAGKDIPNRVSYFITTSGNALKDYGKLVSTYSDSGTGTIPLAGFNKNTDRIFVMAEKVNGEDETDYAGEPVEIRVPGQPEPDPEPVSPSSSFSYDDDDDDDTYISRYVVSTSPGTNENDISLDSAGNMVVRITTNDGGDDSFDHFKGLQINGINQSKGTDYTVERGSTIITLNKKVLDGLDTGTNYMAVFFDDGDIIIPFNASTLTKSGQSKKTAPKAGEV